MKKLIKSEKIIIGSWCQAGHLANAEIDRFCDGGEHKQFGWNRFNHFLSRVIFSNTWKWYNIKSLKVHDSVLMTAEEL